MGTLFRQWWPLKMGTGLAASAAHPRRNHIWVPPPPPGVENNETRNFENDGLRNGKTAQKCKMVMLRNGFFWLFVKMKFRAENGGL